MTVLEFIQQFNYTEGNDCTNYQVYINTSARGNKKFSIRYIHEKKLAIVEKEIQ